MPAIDDTCLACGTAGTWNGHLCFDCYQWRRGTIHPNWTNGAYWDGIRQEMKAPIANAAEARYEVQRGKRTNKPTRIAVIPEELSA